MSTEDQNTLRWLSAGLLFIFLVSLGVYALTFQTGPVSAGLPRPSVPHVASSWKGTIGYGIVTVTGLVVNDTDYDWRGLRIRVACYDRQQNLVGYAHDWLPHLPAGRRWSFRATGTGLPTAFSIARPELNLR